MENIISNINKATTFIQEESDNFNPKIGLILGSGMGAFANEIEYAKIIDYENIPGFPVSTVKGHLGRLVLGTLEGNNVIVMQGRFHYYEGNPMSTLGFPVRVMKKLGIEDLIITNAAGGVNPNFKSGDLMLITDHINFGFDNPLIGKNIEEFGTRFPDNSQTYSPQLLDLTRKVAANKNIDLKEGVYQFMTGPSYETPAEVKMSKYLGADALGMSTFPEALVAHHAGIRVLGISYIANMATGITDETVTHADVLKTMDLIRDKFTKLVKAIVKEI